MSQFHPYINNDPLLNGERFPGNEVPQRNPLHRFGCYLLVPQHRTDAGLDCVVGYVFESPSHMEDVLTEQLGANTARKVIEDSAEFVKDMPADVQAFVGSFAAMLLVEEEKSNLQPMSSRAAQFLADQAIADYTVYQKGDFQWLECVHKPYRNEKLGRTLTSIVQAGFTVSIKPR